MFFFFQAEDGIRDTSVTGVQTCALPISRRMTMKNFALKVAAVGFLGLASLTPSAVLAGKGGSAAAIQAAIASRSVDAIVAEVERSESLICDDCVDSLTRLTEDSRFAVREVA